MLGSQPAQLSVFTIEIGEAVSNARFTSSYWDPILRVVKYDMELKSSTLKLNFLLVEEDSSPLGRERFSSSYVGPTKKFDYLYKIGSYLLYS